VDWQRFRLLHDAFTTAGTLQYYVRQECGCKRTVCTDSVEGSNMLFEGIFSVCDWWYWLQTITISFNS